MTRWPVLIGSEAIAAALGFLAIGRIATRLGTDGFGTLEFALATTSWWLVLVRGGFDAVLVREAAARPTRRPRLATLLWIGRSLFALVAWCCVAGIGLATGRGAVAAIAGLSLFASASVFDLRARATGDVSRIAAGPILRGAALLIGSFFVKSAASAAWAFVAAEVAVVAFYLDEARHASRLDRRMGRLVAARMMRSRAAALSRFARVSLYAADLTILGCFSIGSLGPFAAARRIATAILGLLIVIPATSIGPTAAAWREGRGRAAFEALFARMLFCTLPLSVGLVLTARSWTPLLFGPAFETAGVYLMILAARLPFQVGSACGQSILTAAGVDGSVALWTWSQLGATVVVGSVATDFGGAVGMAAALTALEIFGCLRGFQLVGELCRARETPTRWIELIQKERRLAVGLIGLSVGCAAAGGASVIVRSAYGALGFAVGVHAASVPLGSLRSGISTPIEADA